MSASNTNTDIQSNFADSLINSLITISEAVLEVVAFMFSLYFVPRVIYKTICSKHKSFSIPILSYVCKQIEDFMKPPEGPVIYSFAE
jgi:hypothetical protein